MPREPTPSTCPVCGRDRVRVILWDWACLRPEQRSEFEAGRAILGPTSRPPTWPGAIPSGFPHQPPEAPEWACLRCQPGWSEIHRTALDLDELQLAKENAVVASDFETAAVLLHRQDRIVEGLMKEVRRLMDERPGRPA